MAAVYKTYWVDMPYCVFVRDVFLTTDGYFFRQLTVKAPLRPSGNIKEDHAVFENKFNNEHRDNFPMSAIFPTLCFSFFVVPIKNTIENYQFPIRTLLGIALPFVTGFRSVVVITSALHSEGRRFEPGRKQIIFVFR